MKLLIVSMAAVFVTCSQPRQHYHRRPSHHAEPKRPPTTIIVHDGEIYELR
jgi:hypothetical protein